MLARKASGAQDVSVTYPDLAGGYLTDTTFAGALFPQPVAADGARLDAILGRDPVLIARLPVVHDAVGVRMLDLAAPELRPFAAAIAAWLDAAGVEAVLIRPDRHVFGTGTAFALLSAWVEMANPHLSAVLDHGIAPVASAAAERR